MKSKYFLICFFLVISHNLHAADAASNSSNSSFESEVALRYYQADYVGLGQFVEYKPLPDDIDLGLSTSFIEFEFIPTKIFKDNRASENNPIVSLHNEVLLYRNWAMSRGEARKIRDQNSIVKRRRLYQFVEDASVLNKEGKLSDEEFLALRESTLKAAFAAAINEPNFILRSSHGREPEKIVISPNEQYLAFLVRSPVNTSTFGIGLYYEGIISGDRIWSAIGIIEQDNINEVLGL